MSIFPFSKYVVSGHSMLPALKPGQQVICFNWAYLFSKPKVEDIIVFKSTNMLMIKRIQKISDHQIFVEGDNSKDSLKVEPINKNCIIGKVTYIPKY